MTPVIPTTGCPHCNGVNGYYTAIVLKASSLYNWQGGEVDTENYTVKSEADPRCVDCNKLVRALFKVVR